MVVDAYRASTTIAVLIQKGARVIPVASVEEAASYPGADYRIGERGSAKVRGFDFGNSPTEIEKAGIVPGSTVVLSSTNGTRIIEAAKGSPFILAGAFVNAHAVADAIVTGGDPGSRIAVIGCGWRGNRASEDESAAAEILARLREGGVHLEEPAERIIEAHLKRSGSSLRSNSAARRLKRLEYERDLDYCLALNKVPVVPRLIDGVFAGD
nr:2-phosphosulfolactate phosphatase [Rubrobacter indicoceani]